MEVYVRREAGLVTGVFAIPQPGYAEEPIEDDHPDVVAYQTSRQPGGATFEAAARTAASDTVDDRGPAGKLGRSIVSLTVDEINDLRQPPRGCIYTTGGTTAQANLNSSGYTKLTGFAVNG